MYLSSKLAYLLCTCSKFNDSFMAAMSKQYEKNKIIATRHYFTLYINLKEPTTSDYYNKFAVDDITFTFANSCDIVLSEALQYHNNEVLSKSEMIEIYENLKKQDINLDAFQIVGMYTIAALIKYYKDENFKYIFIPVVINYGRDSSSLHQAALIIDFTGKFLFYEPYGKYVKYGKSYSECICNLFNVLNINTLFNTNNIDSITYHQYLKLDEGIQHILLTTNNAQQLTFNDEYKNIIAEFKQEFPEYDIEPHYSENEIDTDDYTASILDLLFNMTGLYSKINTDTNIEQTKKQTYDRILYKILEQYCCYNSKTCVTITLIELNEFFKHANNLNNSTNMSTVIKSLYNEFRGIMPNHILMDKLHNLLNVFSNSSDIKEIVNNSSNLSGLCSKLFKPSNFINEKN